MLVGVNRLSSMPSHSGSPPSHDSCSASQAVDTRLELIVPNQQLHHTDPTKAQNTLQQLPSLRTVLEPELLDTKVPGQSLRAGSAQMFHSSSVHYKFNSPTLKRRHEFDHGYSERNIAVSQPPFAYRTPLPTANSNSSFTRSSISGPMPSAVILEPHRRESFARTSPYDHTGEFLQRSSMASDPMATIAGQSNQDELGEARGSIRKRPDGSSFSFRGALKVPRCIGQREVPGEGICYVYEDGTYCRAIIDGEPVNPSWGITKAGKPRKRLAQACLTCREKKIKCEPSYPKCQQCTKSQRICKGGLSQSSASSISGEPSPSSPPLLSRNTSTEVYSSAAGSDKEKMHREMNEPFRKDELWSSSAPFNAHGFRPQSVATTASVNSYESDWSGTLNVLDLGRRSRGSYLDMELQWERDPYEVDPKLTMQLLDLYFLHAGRGTYTIFPRMPFLSWVENNREKSPDHIMLLYSILALGSLFSSNLELQSSGKRFAAIASYAHAQCFGRFDLQMCQTRFILSLYNYGQGRSQAAWDFTGAALRAISALKLNMEQGVKKIADAAPALEYGIDRWTYEECCRRTFWSVFLMDRCNGNQGGTLCGINTEDIHVRIPCLESMFETSTFCNAPLFDHSLLVPQASQQLTLGHMACWCFISVIWGDVVAFTARAAHQPESGFELKYTAFYDKTYSKLKAWLDMLPPELQYSPQNLDKSIMEGYAGTFVSIHSLYYAAVLRINRFARVRIISPHLVRRNIEKSFRAASDFLSMMKALAATNRQQRLPIRTATDFQFSTPFPGDVLVLAIDVLTSAGTFSTLPGLIETVTTILSCTDELSSVWKSAETQHKIIETRLKQLRDIATQEERPGNSIHKKFWKIDDGLETAFGSDDVVYGAEDQLRLDVVSKLTDI